MRCLARHALYNNTNRGTNAEERIASMDEEREVRQEREGESYTCVYNI